MSTTPVIALATGHRAGWARLRAELWPDDTEAAHAEEVAAFAGDEALALVAIGPGGQPVGFVEASVRRDYVNGCDTSPVTFVEGLFVAPAWRRQGVARALAAAVERWATAAGCAELASDAPLDNHGSHALHAALGFVETERVVFFRKPLV